MSKGDMEKCGVCKKTVECDETDKESKELFKKDFPGHDYRDSKYVCWDCYNKAMKKKITSNVNKANEVKEC